MTSRDRGTPPPIAAADAVRRGARAVETSFRRSLRRATMVPILLLTGGSILLTVLVLSLRAAHSWIDHTDVVIGRANLVQKLTMEREDALRGFLLSHERTFLDQYNGVDLQLSPLFDELQALVAGNPQLVEVLRAARVEVIRSRHHAAQQMDRVAEGEAIEAIARHVREGTMITRRILDHLDIFIEGEQVLRPERVRRADQLTLYAMIIGAGLGILVGAGIALATAKQMRLIRMQYLDLLEQQERTDRALARANARLRDADRRKDEFLGLLSHELRNPLAPIQNSVQILDRADPTSERSLRARGVIVRQVEHLTRLVEDLLDLTRISSGKMRIRKERIDLVGPVHELVEDLRALFVQKGVRLEARLPLDHVWIDADPTRVSQVVGNLLQNAAKFTDAGGVVTVVVEPGDTIAHVRVRDTGVGIEPELLHSLFDPFVQAPRTVERSRGGLGLGLALVRGIVELHGGTVAVHSEPGHGAEFDVTFLRAPPLEAIEERTPPPVTPPRRRRILVIEDNRDAADSLRDLLEISGNHEVFVTNDGADGISLARAIRPEVIICDLGLPTLDGFEVARRIRAEGQEPCATLVALSGYAAPDDVERSKAAGFEHHLAKPADLDALLRIVASAPELARVRAGRSPPTPEASGGKPDGRPA